MGATNIEYRLPVKKYPTPDSLREWYKREVQQCLYECGHDPYNGTISTTNGINFPTQTFTEEGAAWDWILENTDKRGPVAAIRFGEYWLVGGWAAE